MSGEKSHGRHGGNHSPAKERLDTERNKRPINTDTDSLSEDRNPSKAGGKEIGR